MDNQRFLKKKVIKETGYLLQLAPLPLKQTRITFVSSAALRIHLKGANECNYSAALSAFKCLCVLFGFFFFSKRYAKYLQAVLICFHRQGRKLQNKFLFINFMECGSYLKHIFCVSEGRHHGSCCLAWKAVCLGFSLHISTTQSIYVYRNTVSFPSCKRKTAALAGSARVQLNYLSICEKTFSITWHVPFLNSAPLARTQGRYYGSPCPKRNIIGDPVLRRSILDPTGSTLNFHFNLSFIIQSDEHCQRRSGSSAGLTSLSPLKLHPRLRTRPIVCVWSVCVYTLFWEGNWFTPSSHWNKTP